MAIKIVKSNVDGMTGHFQVTFRVQEGTGDSATFGPEETHGIWPHALLRTYHGIGDRTPESLNRAVKKWLKERHAEALDRKRHIEMTSVIAHGFHGKVVDFE